MKKTFLLNFISLFTSLSTIVCCALPALFVSVGAGATLLAVLTKVPQLIWISEQKLFVFGIAGLFLTIGGVALWKQSKTPCPIDAEKICLPLRKINVWIYIASVVLYLIGAFFAFVAQYII